MTQVDILKLYLLKSLEIETVAKMLTDVYSLLGVPKEILSDLEAQLISLLFVFFNSFEVSATSRRLINLPLVYSLVEDRDRCSNKGSSFFYT